MSENEEILVYDAMRSIQKGSAFFADLINRMGDPASREAYKTHIYAPCIRLQVALGEEAMARGEARHAEIKRKLDEFMALHRKAAASLAAEEGA